MNGRRTAEGIWGQRHGVRRRNTRVLQSFGEPVAGHNNPFCTLLVAALPPEISVRYFHPWKATVTPFDIFHVHWPETLVRSRSRWREVVKAIVVLIVLLRIWVSRKHLVRTVHNELPHEVGSGIEQWILRLIDRRTELWIYLGLGGPQRSPSKIMLHGDYREWFSSFDVPEPECGNVVAFGNVRPYKGFDDLIRCFSTIESDFRLTVAGLPLNSDVRNTILAAATAPNISLELRALSDQELARLIGQAECVALPYMEMRNSGALLVSLSLNRPAIVPASDGAARLSAEVGDGWIVMYEPPLSGSKLRQALQEVRSGHRQGQPDLSRRDWRVLGRELADIYAGLA